MQKKEAEDEEYLKQFMYLDLTIKIEWDKLPKCLQTDFGILKEYYDKNDIALFSSYEESTESTIKMCVLNGSIDTGRQELNFSMFLEYITNKNCIRSKQMKNAKKSWL